MFNSSTQEEGKQADLYEFRASLVYRPRFQANQGYTVRQLPTVSKNLIKKLTFARFVLRSSLEKKIYKIFNFL